MNTKHTREWYVGEPIRSRDTLGINVKWKDGDEEGEETIAEVLPGCGPVKMMEQARLMAAAPELLAALTFSYNGHCRTMHGPRPCTCEFWNQARAAIAKATH